MKYKPLVFLLLGFVSNFAAQAESLLYTDYLDELGNPISDSVQRFSENNSHPERVVNVVISQSKKVDKKSLPLFIENVNTLLSLPAYDEYQAVLRHVYIQTLMLHGKVELALDEIEHLNDETEQKQLHLLWVAGLIQQGELARAVTVFNDFRFSDYTDRSGDYLDLAKEMVVNYGVSSQSIHFPDDGEIRFASLLAEFYEANGVYGLAFVERNRLMQFDNEPESKLRQIAQLVEFSREYDLVKNEVAMMEEYVMLAALKVDASNYDILNNYSHKLVIYYMDKRNSVRRSSRQIESLLAAQKELSKNDSNARLEYLKNRTYLYYETKPDFFYADVAELSVLTQDKQRLSNLYDPLLSDELRLLLLSNYFSIDKSTPQMDIYMADEYASFVTNCEDGVPQLVKLMKAHQAVGEQNIMLADSCFKTINWDEVSKVLPLKLDASFRDEQKKVAYATAKLDNDEARMIAIAQTVPDAEIHLDTALFAVQSQPITFARLEELNELSKTLILDDNQKQRLNLEIEHNLRQSDNKDVLISFLEREPNKNALELAYWSMDNDLTSDSVNYLLMRFKQPTSISEYDEIKVTRYLDSVYSKLTSHQKSKLSLLGNSNINTMFDLQKFEHELSKAFSLQQTNESVSESVKRALIEYRQLSEKLTSFSVGEANYTAHLWLVAELDRLFSVFLNDQAQLAESNVKSVLLKQVSQFRQKSNDSLEQLLQLKIEGVFDLRVWMAIATLREEI